MEKEWEEKLGHVLAKKSIFNLYFTNIINWINQSHYYPKY